LVGFDTWGVRRWARTGSRLGPAGQRLVSAPVFKPGQQQQQFQRQQDIQLIGSRQVSAAELDAAALLAAAGQQQQRQQLEIQPASSAGASSLSDEESAFTIDMRQVVMQAAANPSFSTAAEGSAAAAAREPASREMSRLPSISERSALAEAVAAVAEADRQRQRATNLLLQLPDDYLHGGLASSAALQQDALQQLDPRKLAPIQSEPIPDAADTDADSTRPADSHVRTAAGDKTKQRRFPRIGRQMWVIITRDVRKWVSSRTALMTDLVLTALLGIALGVAQGRTTNAGDSVLWMLITLLAYGCMSVARSTVLYGQERHLYLQLESQVRGYTTFLCRLCPVLLCCSTAAA
jgi:hypothetical protein